MIGFGVSITRDELYRRHALPGIERIREPDTVLFDFGSSGSIFRSYNMLLEKAAAHGGLEALILIHQDAEIIDPGFLPKVREALSDPEVALVGCAGAVDVRSIAWWEGSVTWASFTHRFEEFGGGELPALTWLEEETPAFAETGEVESIDGFVMAFSPWAIENLRFDESIGGSLHGYDFDICMQAREAGKKIVTADLRVIHFHNLELISEVEGWIATHMKLGAKWQHRLPDPNTSWEQRARRAEAELSANKLKAGASQMLWERKVEHLEGLIVEYERSISWRLSWPIRWLGKIMRGGAPRQARSHKLARAQARGSSNWRISSREKAGLPR